MSSLRWTAPGDQGHLHKKLSILFLYTSNKVLTKHELMKIHTLIIKICMRISCQWALSRDSSKPCIDNDICLIRHMQEVLLRWSGWRWYTWVLSNAHAIPRNVCMLTQHLWLYWTGFLIKQDYFGSLNRLNSLHYIP